VECLPCQSDFFVKLKSNRLLQLWTLLWLPLAFLWLLHLGFQLDNLIWAAGDKSFQVMLHEQDTIAMPAWTICNNPGSGITQVKCHFGGRPLETLQYGDGCYAFNEKPPFLVAPSGEGNVNCTVYFQNVSQSAKVFLHDPLYSANIHDPQTGDIVYDLLKRVPSGICTGDIQQGVHTFLWWKRNVFDYLDHTRIVGFTQVSSSAVHDPTAPALNGMLRLEVGDYYEWRYYETFWTSGYDFWYFLGMVGGASFLLLIVHTVFFYPLKHFAFKRDGEEAGRPIRTIDESTSSASSLGSSNINYDAL
jgi:hypothetical protein